MRSWDYPTSQFCLNKLYKHKIKANLTNLDDFITSTFYYLLLYELKQK